MPASNNGVNGAAINGVPTGSTEVDSGAINSHPVNGPAQVLLEIGTGVGELISFEQDVRLIVTSAELLSYEQDVVRIGLGELIAFEQIVQLRLSSIVDEELISFEQIVRAVFTSAQIIGIEQQVRTITPADHLSRTGWDALLVIDGNQIPSSQIFGSIEIDRTENDAALMTVTLIPPTGVQDIELYHGKSVTLDITTTDGTFRAYTGTVDIPDVDLVDERIILRCTDRRTELLNSQLPGIVSTIGVYSPHIFREPRDTAEEVEQRLTTTPFAVDFDAYGNYTITSWTPKATADFTLVDSDVYRDRPKVELTSRGRVTNKVNINLQYRYERFLHGTRTWSWQSPIDIDICKLLVDGYSMTYRATVASAVIAANWPLKTPITFTEIQPGGWYRCGSTTIGWSSIQLRGVNEAVTDEDGNLVSDTDGNQLYAARITGGTDYAPIYCNGATWKGTAQWSQNVTETYTLSVEGPQSTAQFGTIEQDLSYSIDEEADTAGWENYRSFRNEFPLLGDNYAVDQDIKRNEFVVAVDVALRQAKNTILGSHRDTRVTVDTFIKPQIDLKHTVAVTTDEVVAKGKVFNIKHSINIGTGEAVTTTTILLSRIQGSASDSALSIPAKPSDNLTFNTQTIRLGNHFGEDPTTERAKKWNGMIGNRWRTVNNNTFRTTFIESFVVDTPAIPDALRNSKALTGTQSYNVEIPNDTLTITFDGKS